MKRMTNKSIYFQLCKPRLDMARAELSPNSCNTNRGSTDEYYWVIETVQMNING